MLDNQLLCLEICLVCLDQIIMTTYCREIEWHQSQDGSCMPRIYIYNNTVGNTVDYAFFLSVMKRINRVSDDGFVLIL